MMRKLLVALQFTIVMIIAVTVPKPGETRGFDPQPDPPSAFGFVSPGEIRGVSPQPIPPGTIRGVSPQPSPPRELLNGAQLGDGSV